MTVQRAGVSVGQVHVDVQNGTATVVHDGAVPAEELAEACELVGFDAQPLA